MLPLLSFVFAGLALIGLLVGFIPLFGWLNWIVTIPLALVALMLALGARHAGARTLSIVVLALAGLRLFLGGGLL